MKISRTITPSSEEALPFNQWNIFLRKEMNRIRGLKGQLIPNNREFPKGDMTKNKYKNK